MLALMLLERHRKNVMVMQVRQERVDQKTANDGETWWEKRHKRLEEFIEEQIEKNQKEHLIKRKQMEDVYRSRTYESKQRLSNLLNNSNANSDNVNIQSLVSTAASSYEKSIEMVSHDKI